MQTKVIQQIRGEQNIRLFTFTVSVLLVIIATSTITLSATSNSAVTVTNTSSSAAFSSSNPGSSSSAYGSSSSAYGSSSSASGDSSSAGGSSSEPISSSGSISSSLTSFSSSSSSAIVGLCSAIHPCFYGGTCVDITPTEYMCICPQGFTGSRCEFEEYCSIFAPEVPWYGWQNIWEYDPDFVPGGAVGTTADLGAIWIASGVPQGTLVYQPILYIGSQTLYLISITSGLVIRHVQVNIGSIINSLIVDPEDSRYIYVSALAALGNQTNYDDFKQNFTIIAKVDTLATEGEDSMIVRQSGYDIMTMAPYWPGNASVIITTGFTLSVSGNIIASFQSTAFPPYYFRTYSYSFILNRHTLFAISTTALPFRIAPFFPVPDDGSSTEGVLLQSGYADYNDTYYYTQYPAVLWQQFGSNPASMTIVDNRFNNTGIYSSIYVTPFNDVYTVFSNQTLNLLQHMRFNITQPPTNVPNILANQVLNQNPLTLTYVTPWRTVVMGHVGEPYMTLVACPCANASHTLYNTKCADVCATNPCQFNTPCSPDATNGYGYTCNCTFQQLGQDCGTYCTGVTEGLVWTAWNASLTVSTEARAFAVSVYSVKTVWISSFNGTGVFLYQVTYPAGDLISAFYLNDINPLTQISVHPYYAEIIHISVSLCRSNTSDPDKICFATFNTATGTILHQVTAAQLLALLPWPNNTHSINLVGGGIQAVTNDSVLLSVLTSPDLTTLEGTQPCDTFDSCIIRGYTVELSYDYTVVYHASRIPFVSNTTFCHESRTTNINSTTYVFYLFTESSEIHFQEINEFWQTSTVFPFYDGGEGTQVVTFSFNTTQYGSFSFIQSDGSTDVIITAFYDTYINAIRITSNTTSVITNGVTSIATTPWYDILTNQQPGSFSIFDVYRCSRNSACEDISCPMGQTCVPAVPRSFCI